MTYWLSAMPMRRIEPYFPLSHGVPRVDDRRIIGGIIYVIRNGLRWRYAPAEYGPSKTIYNRFIRWSRRGLFNRIFAALAAKCGKLDQLMMDATHLKAHRMAASLQKGAVTRRIGRTRTFPSDGSAVKPILLEVVRDALGSTNSASLRPKQCEAATRTLYPHAR